MRALIFASMALNIIVLLPVYGAILLCSAGLMVKPLPAMVAALLMVQILYKIATPFTVGTFGNPVVLSNLAIAAFHSVTLWSIWRSSSV
jgi:hypothetical protein